MGNPIDAQKTAHAYYRFNDASESREGGVRGQAHKTPNACRRWLLAVDRLDCRLAITYSSVVFRFSFWTLTDGLAMPGGCGGTRSGCSRRRGMTVWPGFRFQREATSFRRKIR